jgi:hypothetical protein
MEVRVLSSVLFYWDGLGALTGMSDRIGAEAMLALIAGVSLTPTKWIPKIACD